MSDYYHAHRTRNLFDPKSKEPFRLSRSGLDLFVNCPRCFYIDKRLGTGRPPGFPFSLNSAVDHLLKKEFDIHRAKNKAHPLMKKYGIAAVPVAHKDLDMWRENFQGIRYCNGRKDREAFDAKLEFDVTLIACKGDDAWVEPAFMDARACLAASKIPKASDACDYCAYAAAAGEYGK